MINFEFILVICQINPDPRYEQTSALVGSKLYFFGGWTTFATNEVWYLDLSSSFNTSIPSWHKDTSIPVGYNFGSSCVSNIENSTVFLIGGRMVIVGTNTFNYSSSVYAFKSKNSQWKAPNITGFNSSFISRNQIQTVIDNNGQIYIFGGSNDNTETFFNDMNILDITTMSWSTPNISQNLPTSRVSYTATLLPNGLVIYIGGYTNSEIIISMNEILIFDTKSSKWSIKNASGNFIESRYDHTSILIPNKNIIIYGGEEASTSIQALPNLAVLDINTWVWSVPYISKVNAPPPLSKHSAELYNNYMIIAFGNNTSTQTLSNSVYIFDTENYMWITTYKFNSTNNSTTSKGTQPSITPESSSNNGIFIGIGIGAGAVVLIGFLSFIGILLYKKHKHRSFIPTPGSLTNEY